MEYLFILKIGFLMINLSGLFAVNIVSTNYNVGCVKVIGVSVYALTFWGSGGVTWLLFVRFQSVEISDPIKMLVTYLLTSVLVFFEFIVMWWRPENYKKNYQTSHMPLSQKLVESCVA